MKPKIRKKLLYTLLLMRDDSHARSFQIRASRLKFLVAFLLFFAMAGIAGWLVSARYIQRFYTLQAEHHAQGVELTQAKLDLEQLRNVKTLAQNSTLPGTVAANTELGVSGSLNGAPQQSNATTGGFFTSNASVLLSSALQANATLNPEAINIASTPISHKDSPFAVEDFTVKKSGQQRILLSYGLVNNDGRQIGGTVSYTLFFKDGSRNETAPQNTRDTNFAISRFKKMDATLLVPNGKRAGDCKKIQLIISTDKGEEYHDTFALDL